MRQALYKKCKQRQSGCVIHIRGGDFKTLGWTAVCSPEYYLKAIGIMKEKHNISDFFYVTDDALYAKSILGVLRKSGVRVTSLMGDTLSDFRTIGSYKYRILSSSTFALWASALGCEASDVIMPAYWSPKKLRRIYLENETRIY